MAGRLSKLMSSKASPRVEVKPVAESPAAPVARANPATFGRDPRLSKYIAQRVFNRPEVCGVRRAQRSPTTLLG